MPPRKDPRDRNEKRRHGQLVVETICRLICPRCGRLSPPAWDQLSAQKGAESMSWRERKGNYFCALCNEAIALGIGSDEDVNFLSNAVQ